MSDRHLALEESHALCDEVYRAAFTAVGPIALRYEDQPICSDCIARAIVGGLIRAAGLHIAHVLEDHAQPAEALAKIIELLVESANLGRAELDTTLAETKAEKGPVH